MRIEPEVITIEAGTVLMGAPAFPAECELPHRWKQREVQVPIFGIAKFATTVGELLAFADQTGYAIAPELRTDPRFRDPRAPAAYTSWIDAVRYVQWLARMTGKPYRLVRDAEYERAARGGLVGKKFPWGDEPPDGRADWGNPNSMPKPVGSFAPNGYGVHDLAGSMWSWCEEVYEQVVRDPSDPSKMVYGDTCLRDTRLNPICRGGSFKSGDEFPLWCAYRHEDPVEGRFDCIGFRVAMSM